MSLYDRGSKLFFCERVEGGCGGNMLGVYSRLVRPVVLEFLHRDSTAILAGEREGSPCKASAMRRGCAPVVGLSSTQLLPAELRMPATESWWLFGFVAEGRAEKNMVSR